MMMRPIQRHRQSQRGAALLTAMIIVTLVATMASAMVWRRTTGAMDGGMRKLL